MKRILPILIFALMLIQFVSAEIILDAQPGELYNLGDKIALPLKITAATELSELFTVELICNGIETEVYKEDLELEAGEEIERTPLIRLIESRIGRSTGTCKIRASVGENYQLTDEFKISDFIAIQVSSEKTEFAPGEEIAIEISALKETGEEVDQNALVETTIPDGNLSEQIEVLDTVNNGYGYITFTMPESTASGEYVLHLNVTERDSQGDITNSGETTYAIFITQVPTELEIVLQNSTINPGESLIANAILRDQTEKEMPSNVTITLKNSDGLVIEKKEQTTSDTYEFSTQYNEPPRKWEIIAESEGFTAEKNFEIAGYPMVETIIANKTLLVANTGNVFYNDTIQIKIGNTSVPLQLALDVDETREFVISAPDGNYRIEIIDPDGNSQITESASLTGNSIGVKEPAEIVKIIRHPLVWLFMAAVLGFGTFMLMKSSYRKKFTGYIEKVKSKKPVALTKKSDSLINPLSPAELSLSIKGNSQTASVICLRFKNFDELKSNKKGTEDTLHKIAAIAEENKTAIYENRENIFFILAPAKTRTFSNEKTAIKIAQAITQLLKNHNKLFRQKIEFGISLSNGTIVAAQDGKSLKFMSMGTLITTAKKIAAISDGEILLGEKIKDKLATMIKTEKATSGNITYFKIKEIKNTEEHKKFIRNFLDRLEKRG